MGLADAAVALLFKLVQQRRRVAVAPHRLKAIVYRESLRLLHDVDEALDKVRARLLKRRPVLVGSVTLLLHDREARQETMAHHVGRDGLVEPPRGSLAPTRL